MIAGRPMLERVVSACDEAARHIASRNEATAEVIVLTPAGDRIAKDFEGQFDVAEAQGDENDVLSRYVEAARGFGADFIVRITGDCPMIPPWVIMRTAALSIENQYDYCSNVDERFRTALDGADCEVVSKSLLEYLGQTARDAEDREHVTTLARRCPPPWARLGFVTGHFDLSWMKLSVDTPEDLERVRVATQSGLDKLAAARRHFGRRAVHLL